MDAKDTESWQFLANATLIGWGFDAFAAQTVYSPLASFAATSGLTGRGFLEQQVVAQQLAVRSRVRQQ